MVQIAQSMPGTPEPAVSREEDIQRRYRPVALVKLRGADAQGNRAARHVRQADQSSLIRCAPRTSKRHRSRQRSLLPG